ncbi:MAG: hypothetical protein JWN38_487 [Candidatus Saccharibacteria bacterium]|nr:hypothetical protein [Candidatus Saccharibacteria bacterium]
MENLSGVDAQNPAREESAWIGELCPEEQASFLADLHSAADPMSGSVLAVQHTLDAWWLSARFIREHPDPLDDMNDADYIEIDRPEDD